MLPYIIEKIPFLGFPLSTYGVMVSIAFLASVYLCIREGKRVGISQNFILDFLICTAIGGFVGSKLLTIIVSWEEFSANPVGAFFTMQGFTFYGGLFGSIIATLTYTKIKKMSYLFVLDAFIPQVALAESLGRIGCFGVGCCFGSPAGADFPFAVRFTNPLSVPVRMGFGDMPLHPSQLYQSFGTLLIFVTLLLWRSRKSFKGEMLIGYLILYSIVRSTVEAFRGDLERGFVIGNSVSTSQFISIIVVLCSTGLYFYLRRVEKMKKD